LIAHPDDERYQHLFGQTAYSPLFDVPVPILAHTRAEMDKGAGIAMCCTFGDLADVDWWRDLGLPLRSCVNKAGRLATDAVDWVTSARGLELAQELAGKTVFSARELVVERLKVTGEIDGEPKATLRMASFYEKGDKPLEIVTSRQWYIKNGGKKNDGDTDLNAELIQRGDQLRFVPDFMRVRYANWVGGLNNDWLISRQRFFGVAFPLWYPLKTDGEVDYTQPILPDESVLPIDPVTDVPAGYAEADRGVPGGFVAEMDIMDTWATSSLTPQIACGWEEPESDFDKLFPMSLRPQGQDIIRTWLFSTVVRAHLEHGQLPWEVAAISGWILDPDRKKMSKSKGNVVTPLHLLEQFGSDAVRYWASAAKLGVDATFDEGKMKIGRRLAMKVLNVTKFVLGITSNQVEVYDNYLVANLLDFDQALLAQLNVVVAGATQAFENYDHARALEITETFFWEFCDDYVELVKRRAYNQSDESGNTAYSDTEVNSARTTLILTLRTLLNLLAPFLPFATEEAWSWFNDSSIHRTTWASEIAGVAVEQSEVWSATTEVLEVLRRVKSDHKVSMKTALKDVVVAVPETKLQLVQSALADLRATLNIVGNFEVVSGQAVAVDRAQVVE
jgi:valyl-tRNA synthetase